MPIYTYVSGVDLHFEKKIVASTGLSPISVKLTPVKQIAVEMTKVLTPEEQADLDQFMTDNDFVFDSVTP